MAWRPSRSGAPLRQASHRQRPVAPGARRPVDAGRGEEVAPIEEQPRVGVPRQRQRGRRRSRSRRARPRRSRRGRLRRAIRASSGRSHRARRARGSRCCRAGSRRASSRRRTRSAASRAPRSTGSAGPGPRPRDAGARTPGQLLHDLAFPSHRPEVEGHAPIRRLAAAAQRQQAERRWPGQAALIAQPDHRIAPCVRHFLPAAGPRVALPGQQPARHLAGLREEKGRAAIGERSDAGCLRSGGRRLHARGGGAFLAPAALSGRRARGAPRSRAPRRRGGSASRPSR